MSKTADSIEIRFPMIFACFYLLIVCISCRGLECFDDEQFFTCD